MMITKTQLKRMVAEELIYELHGKLPNMTAEESEKVWTAQRQEVRETLAMYDEGPQDDESAQAAINILQDEGILPPGNYRGLWGIKTLRDDLEESEKIGAAQAKHGFPEGQPSKDLVQAGFEKAFESFGNEAYSMTDVHDYLVDLGYDEDEVEAAISQSIQDQDPWIPPGTTDWASIMSESARSDVGRKIPDDVWDAIDRVAYMQEREALVDMANEFEAGGQTDLVDIKHKIETLRRVNEVRGSSYGSYPLQTVVAAIVGALNELPKLVPDRSKWLPGYTGDVQKWAKKRDPSGANARNLKRDLVQAWRHLPDNQEPRSVIGKLR